MSTKKVMPPYCQYGRGKRQDKDVWIWDFTAVPPRKHMPWFRENLTLLGHEGDGGAGKIARKVRDEGLFEKSTMNFIPIPFSLHRPTPWMLRPSRGRVPSSPVPPRQLLVRTTRWRPSRRWFR